MWAFNNPAAPAPAEPPIPSLVLPQGGGPVGLPLTPRQIKSSVQLKGEVGVVRRNMQRMEQRTNMALTIVRGQHQELEKCSLGMRQMIEQNPTICKAPHSPEAYAAANAAVDEDAVLERARTRFGREPRASEMAVELRLARGKERARREESNAPVVEAMKEMLENCELGEVVLLKHAETLERCCKALNELNCTLATHLTAHAAVAGAKTATSRCTVARADDNATHEALKLATKAEASARQAALEGTKAAQRERGNLEARKADMRRAVAERTKLQQGYYRQDNAGTSFKGWSSEELKHGAD